MSARRRVGSAGRMGGRRRDAACLRILFLGLTCLPWSVFAAREAQPTVQLEVGSTATQLERSGEAPASILRPTLSLQLATQQDRTAWAFDALARARLEGDVWRSDGLPTTGTQLDSQLELAVRRTLSELLGLEMRENLQLVTVPTAWQLAPNAGADIGTDPGEVGDTLESVWTTPQDTVASTLSLGLKLNPAPTTTSALQLTQQSRRPLDCQYDEGDALDVLAGAVKSDGLAVRASGVIPLGPVQGITGLVRVAGERTESCLDNTARQFSQLDVGAGWLWRQERFQLALDAGLSRVGTGGVEAADYRPQGGLVLSSSGEKLAFRLGLGAQTALLAGQTAPTWNLFGGYQLSYRALEKLVVRAGVGLAQARALTGTDVRSVDGLQTYYALGDYTASRWMNAQLSFQQSRQTLGKGVEELEAQTAVTVLARVVIRFDARSALPGRWHP